MPLALGAEPHGIVLNFAAAKSVPADSHDGTVGIAAAWLVFYLVILGSSVFSSATEIAGLY
jgi:hypothetical protein